jgi:hypothetical protein
MAQADFSTKTRSTRRPAKKIHHGDTEEELTSMNRMAEKGEEGGLSGEEHEEWREKKRGWRRADKLSVVSGKGRVIHMGLFD